MAWECNRCLTLMAIIFDWFRFLQMFIACQATFSFQDHNARFFWGLWSLRCSDKCYSLQRWIWRLHRHSLREIWPGRRCLDSHPDTLWESPARRQHYGSLCQERFWDKWTQRQNGVSCKRCSMPPMSRYQFVRCFTEPPTYRLVAIPRKGS